MMKRLICILGVLFVAAVGIYGQSIQKQSGMNYKETRQKIEHFIKSKQLSIFASHDHAKAASSQGLFMPASIVIFFGNAKVGTPVMLDNPVWSLHLPLKVAIFDDKEGRTWIAVPDLKSIAAKDKLSPEQQQTIDGMSNLLNALLNIQ